jgi:membrane protease YdiL (CAAX protease family)
MWSDGRCGTGSHDMTEHAVAGGRNDPGGIPRGKLTGWIVFVAALAALAYAANLASEGDPAPDILYQWATVVGALVQYGIMTGVALLIARGIPRVELGLCRPQSWGRAAGLIVASIVAVWLIAAALNFVLEAGEEQGLVPDSWDGSRAVPFAANFVVIAVVAPIVEEFVFRGLGMAVVGAFYGVTAAVVVTGLGFGLAHGLIVALPVLTIFGVILGWLRHRTESLYPPIILHAIFNGSSLLAAVVLG